MPKKSEKCPHCQLRVAWEGKLYRQYACGSIQPLFTERLERTRSCEEIERLRSLLRWAHGQAKYLKIDHLADGLSEFALMPEDRGLPHHA